MPPALQPAAHALVASGEELGLLLPGLAAEEIWTSLDGAATIGFHLVHLSGSTDRLLTYARGEPLSERQQGALAAERALAAPYPEVESLVQEWKMVVDRALVQLARTPAESLTAPRFIGRARLPSNVLGVLFHAAEHAQRHTGQVVTTAKILTGRRPPPAPTR